MSGATDLASAIKATVNRPVSLLIAEGVVTVSGNLASVTGIAANSIQVDRSNWSRAFAAAVATTAGVNGRRVLVLFADRQAYISDVVG